MGRRSSRKGSTFEREICVQLSLWLSDYTRDDLFWRTATSGARATVRAKLKKTTAGGAGDIQATDPLGIPFISRYAIELKRGYAKATLSDIADLPARGRNKTKPELLQFIYQAQAAKKQGQHRHWMIIHKRDRRDTLVYLPHTVSSLLQMRIAILPASQLMKSPHFPKGVSWVMSFPFQEMMRMKPAIFMRD